jgi:heme exporter protein A
VLNVSALECVRGERRLFADLSFSLGPHTLLEVRGANGSGKTSLLRILCGLLTPAAGTITWNGLDVHDEREEYGAQLAYVGHLNGIKDDLSPLENLHYAGRIAGLAVNDRAVEAALDRMGLSAFRHAPCRTLSQGQRRRVSLARLCLSGARPLWVLDEPFTALDAASLALTRTLFETHLVAGGMLVLTSHQDAPISAPSVQRIEL